MADKMIKVFKESTDAPEGKEKVPPYIHNMVGFRSLEAEQRRMTASYAITITFDGGFMTNLRAEWTWRRTDDDLVPQGFVAVHTQKPLSFVVIFSMVRFPSLTMVLALKRIPSDLFHMIPSCLG